MTSSGFRLLPASIPHGIADRIRERVERPLLDPSGREDLANHVDERLRRAERERDAALAANRATDAFLAELSHELRSPLHVITSWILVLRAEGTAGELQQRALAAIERNLRVQAALVDELCDVARIATGKLELESAPVDLVTIVSGVVDDFRLVADLQDVALQGPSAGEPLIVRGDAARLAQVVANLLTNALKFTPAGGTVQVALVPETTRIVLEVRDTGQGIDPELLPYVFDRFRQGDAHGSKSRRGLGLGLAIAKQLVERQGGSIGAESEGVGRGALFRVTLRREAAAPQPFPAAARSAR